MIGKVAAFSETGPRHNNEDGYAFWWAGATFVAVVADGLGGMGGGGHASSYVVDLGAIRQMTACTIPVRHGRKTRKSRRWMAVGLFVEWRARRDSNSRPPSS